MSKASKWRNTKPKNTSWEPNMGGPVSSFYKTTEKEYMRDTLGTAWGVGKTWAPDHVLEKRVKEEDARRAKELRAKSKNNFSDLFAVSKKSK